MLKKKQLVYIVRYAFSPLECVAELQNYEHAFGFRVGLPDGTGIIYEEKNASLLQDEGRLASLISEIRSRVEKTGVILDPWSFPSNG